MTRIAKWLSRNRKDIGAEEMEGCEETRDLRRRRRRGM